jgi:hypothetical protein
MEETLPGSGIEADLKQRRDGEWEAESALHPVCKPLVQEMGVCASSDRRSSP